MGMGDRERVRKKSIFYLLVHSQNVHNDWGWARPKPEATNFILGVAGA